MLEILLVFTNCQSIKSFDMLLIENNLHGWLITDSESQLVDVVTSPHRGS